MKIFKRFNKSSCNFFWGKILGIDHSECCEIHDKDYWRQKEDRYLADVKFYWCLREKTYKIVALSMYYAVRLFGWYYWNKNTKKKENLKK